MDRLTEVVIGVYRNDTGETVVLEYVDRRWEIPPGAGLRVTPMGWPEEILPATKKYDVVRIAGGVKTYDEVEAEDRDQAARAVKRERHLVTLTAAAPTQSFYREDDGMSLGTNDPVAVIAVNDQQ